MDSIKTSKSVKSYAPQKDINVEGFAHKSPALASRFIGKSQWTILYLFGTRMSLYQNHDYEITNRKLDCESRNICAN